MQRIFKNKIYYNALDVRQAINWYYKSDEEFWLGLQWSVAAAWYPGALSRHVWRIRTQVQKYRTVGPHLEALRRQNCWLRPVPWVPNRKGPWRHFSWYELDIIYQMTCSLHDLFLLDIPLPVRPFGSQTAYASVEEALKAFVTPETLDGNNQYWCDVCGKKCDAHKGLKFSRFPYLLTLHLKRFDFDYSTLHRIKLNDKVTFPEILSLESFLQDEQHPPDRTNNNKDSQASADTAVDQDSMSEVSESSRANSSNDTESQVRNDNHCTHHSLTQRYCQDDDEGIDVRAEGCTSSTSCDSSESNSNNRRNARAPSSAYNYELFSIMIHSGSASGGHYYAYIKDFTSQQW